MSLTWFVLPLSICKHTRTLSDVHTLTQADSSLCQQTDDEYAKKYATVLPHLLRAVPAALPLLPHPSALFLLLMQLVYNEFSLRN